MVSRFLKRTPVLKFVIPLIGGILVGYESEISAKAIFYVSFVAVLLLAIAIVLQRNASYRWYFLPGINTALLTFLIGFIYIEVRQPVVINTEREAHVVVHIISEIRESQKNKRYEVRLLQTNDSLVSNADKLKGKLLIPKEKLESYPKIGEQWLIVGRFLSFQKAPVPHMFDYSNYLIKNRISFQIYAYGNASKNLGKTKGFNIEILSVQLRQSIMALFASFGMEKAQLAVLNALFLGDKGMLSSDQKSQFSSAGAMHLLAVSGLHVGIIYLIVSSFLSMLGLGKNRLHTVFLIVFVLWAYALLTGLSPSVMRASIMLTIIEVGKLFNRRLYVFNVLSISMLIILMIEPLSVYSVGFWLSHVAVASIIIFYPIVNRMLTFKFILFRWLWSLIAVSIAAQIGTFPICIAIFNDFPIYFIVTNVLLIPIVGPILMLAITTVVFQWIPFLAEIFAGCLSDLLFFLNACVAWIDTLPGAVLTHLYMNEIEMTLYYLGVVLLIGLQTTKRVVYAKCLLFTTFFTSLFIATQMHWTSCAQLTVANISGQIVINYFDHNVNQLYADKELSARAIQYYFKGLWSRNHVEEVGSKKRNEADAYQPLVYKKLGEEHLLIVRKDLIGPTNEGELTVNCIVLTNDTAKIIDLDYFEKRICWVVLKDETRLDIEKLSEEGEKVCVLRKNEVIVFKEKSKWNKLRQIIFGNMVTLSINLR